MRVLIFKKLNLSVCFSFAYRIYHLCFVALLPLDLVLHLTNSGNLVFVKSMKLFMEFSDRGCMII
jgi:hypothetical protein